MGEAKRRKDLGLYPKQTLKPETVARKKIDYVGYGTTAAMLGLLAATYPKFPVKKEGEPNV